MSQPFLLFITISLYYQIWVFQGVFDIYLPISIIFLREKAGNL